MKVIYLGDSYHSKSLQSHKDPHLVLPFKHTNLSLPPYLNLEEAYPDNPKMCGKVSPSKIGTILVKKEPLLWTPETENL
jgi:hypothetical protein